MRMRMSISKHAEMLELLLDLRCFYIVSLLSCIGRPPGTSGGCMRPSRVIVARGTSFEDLRLRVQRGIQETAGGPKSSREGVALRGSLRG
eukprot:317530-Pyramimonas_sp.AAC.2